LPRPADGRDSAGLTFQEPQVNLHILSRRHRMAAPWLAVALLLSSAAQAQTSPERAPTFEQISEQTREVAERYFQAYVAMDWARVATLLAEQASFSDPTATTVFGQVAHRGKTAVLKGFTEGYAALQQMRFVPQQRFFSGRHAVFSGQLDWTMKLDNGRLVHTVMPLVTTLRVEDGLVLEHVDLADYHPFVVALRQARAAPAN
jgi:hypothetical protein